MVRSTSELSNATWWTPRADEPGRSVVERRYLERIRSRSASIAARSRSVIEETVLRGGGDVISPFGEKPRYWLNAEWFDADQSLSLIHISEPTRQAEISYAVFCLKK